MFHIRELSFLQNPFASEVRPVDVRSVSLHASGLRLALAGVAKRKQFARPLGHEACESNELRNLVNYLLGSNSTCTILNEVVDF